MSGDLSTPAGRFSTIKKYPGSPMSPNTAHSTSGARAANSRNRVLTSKIAAPRPINLPSLRRENAASSEWPSSTTPSSVISSGNGSANGWGSPSPAVSPFSSPHKPEDLELKPDCQSTSSSDLNNNNNKPRTPEQLSPVLSKTSALSHEPLSPVNSPHSTPPRAWATPTPAAAATVAPADFPTAAELLATDGMHGQSKKSEQIDQISNKSVLPEPEHLDWDEMVRQDLEAHIDDDGQEDTLTPPESETVLPSDRFTEDYDRSYPPHIRQVTDDHDRNDGGHHSHWAHRESTRRENGSGNAYNWREGHGRPIGSGSGSGSSAGTAGAYHREQEREREWRSRCERSAPWSNDQQTWVDRDRSRSKNRSERRSSNDKKLNFQPTVLKRPRRMSEQSARSDRSRDEHTVAHEPIASALDSLPEIPPTRPTELTAAQRKVMLSAAERAKKRRDEEEAEREAARERARQKALALAPLADKKPKESIEVKDDHNKGEGPTEAQQDLASHSIGSNDEPKAPVREKPEEVKPNVPEDAPTNTESMEDTPEKTNGRDIAPKPEKETEEKKVKDEDSDEDVAEWNQYVENLRDNKSRSDSRDTGASAWNAYAERLQVKDEERWHKSVDQYAAERNLDPAIFRDLRKFDKAPSTRSVQREGKGGKEVGKRRERKDIRGERRHSASGKYNLDNEEMWPSLAKAPANKGGSDTATDGPSRKPLSSIPDDNDNRGANNHHDDSATVKEFPVEESSGVPKLVDSHPSESSSAESKAVATPTDDKGSKKEILVSSESSRVNWNRKELRDLLLRSEGPIFPAEIERLAGKKPPHLSFMMDRTVSISPTCEKEHHGRDRSPTAYPSVRNKTVQSANNEHYGDDPASQEPPLPFSTPGNPNYPVLFYQMPFSNGSYMSNTPVYAVRPDQQQQQQQRQQSQQLQQQQQRVVYLLPPQHMIPPWPGMPVQFNNARRHR